MNIALIIERFDIALGGAERSVRQIAEQLEAMGHRTTILASVAPAAAPGVTALCGHQSRERVPFSRYRAALEAHLKTADYDIIHSTLPFDGADLYQPRGGSYAQAALRSAAAYPNPLITLFKRATGLANSRRRQYIRAERQLCSGSTVLIAALSDYVKRQFQRRYHLPDQRIALTPGGVKIPLPIDPDQAGHCERQVISALQADRSQATVLLFAANNFRLKGLHDLLNAMSVFKQRMPSHRLVLIVAGSGKQRPFRRLAARLNIDSDVYFAGYTDAVENYLAICDAAVLPTYYDPCSRFILEALALTKPVLTTRYNGAAEVYQHLRHGIILDEPNPIEPFVHGLTALSQPENRRHMSEAIRQDGLTQAVSIENHCTALINLYQSIYNQKHKTV